MDSSFLSEAVAVAVAADHEVLLDCPYFRIYKGGKAERHSNHPIVPASLDDGGVCRSKDVQTSPENNVSARLFLPKTVGKCEKLPVLIYIHGGAFMIGSAFNSVYNAYVSSLAAEANVLAVSIEYRLAPEHPVATCFDDCWETVKWVTSHRHGSSGGSEPWISDHADLNRIYLAGDSAGGTLAQNMAMRVSSCINGVREDGYNSSRKIAGMVLVHSFFGSKPDDEYLWKCLYSVDEKSVTGLEDPRLNPMGHPELLRELKCDKILILTAEKDIIKDRSWQYYEALKNSGWDGEVEIMDTEGEDHDFHIINPNSENAHLLMKKIVSFIKN